MLGGKGPQEANEAKVIFRSYLTQRLMHAVAQAMQESSVFERRDLEGWFGIWLAVEIVHHGYPVPALHSFNL